MRSFSVLRASQPVLFLILALAGLFVLGVGGATAGAPAHPAAAWVPGDVFVGVQALNPGDPAYLVFANDGTPKGSLPAQPGDTGAHAGCAFAPNGDLYTTNADTSVVTVYSGADPHAVVTTIPTTSLDGGAELESVTFAANGNFLVGHADVVQHNLAEYTPGGSFVRSWSPATENKGIDWIDLAADQQTLFYTSEGAAIKRFDLTGAGTQLPDFAVLSSPPAPGENFAFRLLPPGDGTGDVLVAETSLADHRFGGLLRLDGSGQIAQTYSLPGGNPGWFALNRDPNGTSFWSATTVSGQVYRFGIASGQVEVGPVDASQGGRTNTVRGLCVKGEITVGQGTPTPTPGPGQPTATPLPASPTPCAPAFSDVQPGDYFYTAVGYLACRGIIAGYADGTFRPYNATTRGQLAKIVVGAVGWTIDTSGGPHFSDVPPSNPFYPYIETAYHHGAISGYADGTFRWGNEVTRGQLSKIVVGAFGWPINTSGGPHFSDVPPSNPFYPFVETAVNAGIISGYGDGTFRWGDNATRGQISKIVYLALGVPPAAGQAASGSRPGRP